MKIEIEEEKEDGTGLGVLGWCTLCSLFWVFVFGVYIWTHKG